MHARLPVRALRRRAATALTLGLLLAPAATAHAELRLRVERDVGAESCPGESALRRMIQEELDGPTNAELRLSFTATQGVYSATLQIGARTRTIRGRECGAVGRSAALAAAIALAARPRDDASASAPARPPEADPPSEPPGAVIEATPPLPDAPRPDATRPDATRPPERSVLPRPASPSPPAASPPPNTRRAPTREPIGHRVTAGAAGVVGYAPTATAELNVGALLDAPHWSVGARMRVTLPTEVESAAAGTVTGSMQLATLLGCGRLPILSGASLEGCGALSAGFVDGDGDAFDRITPGAAPAAYLGAEIAAWIVPIDALAFRLAVAPEIALVRGRLLIGDESGYSDAWAADRFGLRLGIEIGLR